MENQELEQALAAVYAMDNTDFGRTSYSRVISVLCDDFLDTSGALLGRVRDRATKIQAFLKVEDLKRHISVLEGDIADILETMSDDDVIEYLREP